MLILILLIMFMVWIRQKTPKQIKRNESKPFRTLMALNINGDPFKGGSTARKNEATKIFRTYKPDVVFLSEPTHKDEQDHLGNLIKGSKQDKRQGITIRGTRYKYMGFHKECGFLFHPKRFPLTQITTTEWYKTVRETTGHEAHTRFHTIAQFNKRCFMAESPQMIVMSVHCRHITTKRTKKPKPGDSFIDPEFAKTLLIPKKEKYIKHTGLKYLLFIANVMRSIKNKPVVLAGDFNYTIDKSTITWPKRTTLVQHSQKRKKIDYFIVLKHSSFPFTWDACKVHQNDGKTFDHDALILSLTIK